MSKSKITLVDLVAFVVTQEGKVEITYRGTAKAAPSGEGVVANVAGEAKGTRVLTLDPGTPDTVAAFGLISNLPDSIEFDGVEFDAAADHAPGTRASWYAWYRHYVPQALGGLRDNPEGYEALVEPEEEPETQAPSTPLVPQAEKPKKGKKGKKGKKPAEETAEEAGVAADEPGLDREAELTALKSAGLKALCARYTEAGFEVLPARSIAETVQRVLAIEETINDGIESVRETMGGNANAVKKALKDTEDVMTLRRMLVVEGDASKPRKSILAAVAKQLAEIEKATAAEAEEAPKVPKPKRQRKVKEPAGPSEEDQQAEEVGKMLRPILATLLQVRGSGRKARLDVTNIIASLEEEALAQGNPHGILIQAAGKKKPLGHVEGRVWKATKNHSGRNAEYGTCEYHAECLPEGKWKIVHFVGNRKDIKKGDEFENANAMLRVITGRDYPRVQVYRYFNDGYDDSKVKAA